MKKIATTIIVITLIGLFNTYGQSTHVLYGERSLEKDTACLYFDKEGYLYPSYKISSISLESTNGSLKDWYKKNEALFLEIAKQYNCNFDKFNAENCTALNDSITQTFIRYINGTTNTTISFFIHGFRKSFKSINGDADSPKDFNTLTNTFKNYNKSNSKSIEIYWDALYDCCFSASSKNNKPLFQLFEQAQENAEFTGNKFKSILSGITKDTINIITHSLGAKVAIYGVLNITNENSVTPSNKRVNICLIAPAISPDLIKENFFSRNSSIDFKRNDNYFMYIVYNEKDFVLKKKDNRIGLFGPGPYKYGNTTLGCNYNNAATLLASHFKVNFPQSSIRLYDLSSVRKCHHVRCYCYNNHLEDTFRDMEK